MKPEQKYQSLKDLAERMKITVSEQNLQKTGVRAKSGLCKVKEEYLFIMDKRKTVAEKIEILSECLSKMPHEGIYIVPAIRNLLKPEQKSIFDE